MRRNSESSRSRTASRSNDMDDQGRCTPGTAFHHEIDFQQTLSQATSLVTAAGQHLTQFGAAGGQNQAQIRVVPSQVSACGKCNNGQLMDLKANSAGNDNNHGARDAMFYRALHAPRRASCRAKRSSRYGRVLSYLQFSDPRGDEERRRLCVSNMSILFQNPPAWSREVATSGKPCFKCSHSECPRAGRARGSDTPVLRCRNCSTHDMLLNKRKKYSVSCSGYKEDLNARQQCGSQRPWLALPSFLIGADGAQQAQQVTTTPHRPEDSDVHSAYSLRVPRR